MAPRRRRRRETHTKRNDESFPSEDKHMLIETSRLSGKSGGAESPKGLHYELDLFWLYLRLVLENSFIFSH